MGDNYTKNVKRKPGSPWKTRSTTTTPALLSDQPTRTAFAHFCTYCMYTDVWSWTDSIFLKHSLAWSPDLCRVQALPPWGLGGLCGIWRGSDGTPELEGAWRRSRGVEHMRHSWKESGRVWAQAHGLCEECRMTSRQLKAPHLVPDSYSRPRLHRGSKREKAWEIRRRQTRKSIKWKQAFI